MYVDHDLLLCSSETSMAVIFAIKSTTPSRLMSPKFSIFSETCVTVRYTFSTLDVVMEVKVIPQDPDRRPFSVNYTPEYFSSQTLVFSLDSGIYYN